MSLQEYKGIRAIYPPTPGTVLKSCTSCRGDVQTDNGFADMAGPPFKSYLCASCTMTAIGSVKAAELLQYAQDTYRKTLT